MLKIDAGTLDFLKKLKKNNNKDWFDANREKYDVAKQDFIQNTASLIKGISSFDEEFAAAEIEPKKCISRINRDIRFSKDKTPYKTNFFSIINQGGKKSNLAGYFFQLQPGNSFVGGGVYMPESNDLLDIRKEIHYHLPEWKKIAEDKSFLKVFPDGVQSPEILTRVPKGFDANDPAEEYIRMKGFFTYLTFSDEELMSGKAEKKIFKAYESTLPLIRFINKALS
jgi:uncharacterized protein (TIGR02453 family)